MAPTLFYAQAAVPCRIVLLLLVVVGTVLHRVGEVSAAVRQARKELDEFIGTYGAECWRDGWRRSVERSQEVVEARRHLSRALAAYTRAIRAEKGPKR